MIKFRNVWYCAFIGLCVSDCLHPCSATAQDDCLKMSALMKEKASDFSRIQGAYDSGLGQYVATIYLPGAEECSVMAGEFPEYSCQWNIPLSSEVDGVKELSDLIDQVKKCVSNLGIKKESVRHTKNTKIEPKYEVSFSDKTIITMNDGAEISLKYMKKIYRIQKEKSKYLLYLTITPNNKNPVDALEDTQ